MGGCVVETCGPGRDTQQSKSPVRSVTLSTTSKAATNAAP